MEIVLSSGIWLFAIAGIVLMIATSKRFRLAIQSPYRWILLTILTLPIDRYQFGGTWNIRFWNIILLAAGLELAINAIRGKAIVLGRLAPVLVLLVSVSLLSFFNSVYFEDSARQGLKLVLVDLLLYIVTVNLLDSLDAVEAAVFTVIISSAIVALWGIIQLGAWLFFNVNWMIVLSYRPSAWFTEATWYGEYLAFGMSVTVPFIVLREPKQKVTSLWWIVALQTLGIFLSATRTAWIALVAIWATVFLLIMIQRRVLHGSPIRLIYRSVQFLSLMIVVFLLGFNITLFLFPLAEIVSNSEPSFSTTIGASSYFQQRFDLSDKSVMGRMESTESTLLAALRHPIIGNGIGTWGRTFAGHFEGAVQIGGSHFNIFLGSFYDAGLLGLAVTFMLVGVCLETLVRIFRRCSSNPRCLRLAWSGLLSFACTLAISQLNPWYLTGYAWMGFSLIFALWAVVEKHP